MKRVLVAVSVSVLAAAGVSAPAAAETEYGKKPKLTVSTDVIAPKGGTKVTVKGSGYAANKGVYVALCKDNGKGVKPGPCYGGDRGGAAQAWVSGLALAQGMGATKLGKGGTFTATLTLGAAAGDLDCTKVRCVIATRNDHFATADRSQDVLIPARVGKLTAAKLTVKRAKKTLTATLALTLDGKKASWPGQKVYLERKAGKKWVRVGSALTSGKGVVKLKLAKKGTYRTVFTGGRKAVSASVKY
ncbi:hypothetical protein GCM10027589_50370 [Actinocorallia lasiicapitis]